MGPRYLKQTYRHHHRRRTQVRNTECRCFLGSIITGNLSSVAAIIVVFFLFRQLHLKPAYIVLRGLIFMLKAISLNLK